MHATHNTLSETIRAQSAGLLNLHLAAPIDLRGQVKQAHWNVSGAGFMAVHQLFDDVSGEVKTCSDMIVERAGGVGSTALGTVQVATERSFLVPYTLGVADVTEHIFAASATPAAFGQSIREDAAQATGSKDANTSDLSTEISRGIDRQLWFVESHAPAKTDVQAVQK